MYYICVHVVHSLSVLTFEVNKPILDPLDLDGLVAGLVALKLDAALLVAHEALVALEDEDGSVDQVEEVSGVVLNTVAVGKQVSRLFIADIFA